MAKRKPGQQRRAQAKPVRWRPPLPGNILRLARNMRTEPTDAEGRLWRFLRERGLGGFKFRRQHPAGPFILDFYCPEAKLAAELDGGGHADGAQVLHDAERDTNLAQRGIVVTRFWNTDMLKNPQGVLEELYAALLGRCPDHECPERQTVDRCPGRQGR